MISTNSLMTVSHNSLKFGLAFLVIDDKGGEVDKDLERMGERNIKWGERQK